MLSISSTRGSGRPQSTTSQIGAMRSSKKLLGHKSRGSESPKGNKEFFFEHKNINNYPLQKDWQQHVHSIRTAVDQGACGSCWAVTTSRLLASHSEIYMGHAKRKFSTQEIVDCTPNPQHCGGSGGCDGATVTLGLDQVMRNNVNTPEDYPYSARTGTCSRAQAHMLMNNDMIVTGEGDKTVQNGKYDSNSAGPTFGFIGWSRLPINKEAPLIAAAQHGPVAVSVDGSPWSSYDAGIFTHCDRHATVNHAVLMIGYGFVGDGSHKYWLIQNSWGPNWGESGNIRLQRHEDEEAFCGIDRHPEEGSGCIGGPATIPVCGSCGILSESALPYFAAAPAASAATATATADTASADASLTGQRAQGASQIDASYSNDDATMRGRSQNPTVSQSSSSTYHW
eukprot:gnl/TRDRNA2_/TRDRNA2_158289_c1_seq1.p1 gnl/TRDRNA2_/TRDRNA2_158289_c1~~gnl/TRDRNA2_/TRDRNA2_158289_c1_seq1.p1  ORF type:complete len:396 (-),score=37.93 gnl/TRDRNA2_/TRDRNA2_158289_c1_seq1:127-1314(-)